MAKPFHNFRKREQMCVVIMIFYHQYYSHMQPSLNKLICSEATAIELQAKLKGQILQIGDEKWKEAITSFNKDSESQVPLFLVKCASENDVIACVEYAQTNNLSLTPRCGAHNLGNFSLINGGIVADVRPMKEISHSIENSTITYQAGCTNGDLDNYLQENAKGYTFIGTMDYTIGTSGPRLALGVGWQQRYLGNAIDNLVSMRVVLASGIVVNASQNQNADLFIAMKGAGSNYGVVVEFTERIHNVLDPNQGKQVLFSNHFYDLADIEQLFPELVKIYNHPDLPDKVMIVLVAAVVDKKKGLIVETVHYKYDGKQIDTSASWVEKELRSIQEKYKPTNLHMDGTEDGWGYISHLRLQTGTHMDWGNYYYPTGGFLEEDKLEATVFKLLRYWKESNVPLMENDPLHVTAIYQFGGKRQKERDPKKSAWPGNEKTRALAVTWAGWKQPQQKEEVVGWVKNQWKDAYKDLQFGYLCAAAYDWKSKSHAKWIYGPNYEELVKIKKKYDPSNFFSHNVNIQ